MKGKIRLSKRTFKTVVTAVACVVVLAIGLIVFACVTETVGAGYVGYRYDRTVKNGSPNTIPGTSIIDEPLTGRIYINPFTQSILKYPTTIVAKNWTNAEEGDNKVDMSMQMGSKEGKNIDADIYISVRPLDLSKIISSFGTKSFSDIVDDDVYGLVKGKLSTVAQSYSVYDMQSSRSKIQDETREILSKELEEVYGIELKKFEIGTLILPQDIQDKIDEKTKAANEVELAKLDRERQDQVNQKIVDEQRAKSEQELVRREAEADAAAYEKEKAAQAQLVVAENNVKIAEQKVIQAQLEKQAELEKQSAFTEEYFRDKELEVQKEAVRSINGSVKTIITDGTGNGYEALVGIREVLDGIK